MVCRLCDYMNVPIPITLTDQPSRQAHDDDNTSENATCTAYLLTEMFTREKLVRNI